MNDIGVAGHITIDQIITKDEKRIQLGGPPIYISQISRLLGVSIEIATKVGRDFPTKFAEYMNKNGLDISNSMVESPTTRFILDYTFQPRKMSITSICDSLEPSDVEKLPKNVILSPIINEIPKKTYEALKDRVLALDPQGLIRQVQRDSTLVHVNWRDKQLLGSLDVFKSTGSELRFIVNQEDLVSCLKELSSLGVKVSIVTLGEKGALVLADDILYSVPSYESVVGDPTGAGDVFLGGFFIEYVMRRDISWCCAMGAAAASGIVESYDNRIHLGLCSLVERAEIIHDEITRKSL